MLLFALIAGSDTTTAVLLPEAPLLRLSASLAMPGARVLLRRGACPRRPRRSFATSQAPQQHLFPGIKRMCDLVVERGEGSTVWTREGEAYLDVTAGIGVVSTGHCHPHVVAAVREQAGKISHAQQSCHYSDAQLRLVEHMLPILPRGMDRVFFANSGAEAVENALRTARLATGRDAVIAMIGGYHGRTAATLAITSSNTSYRGAKPVIARRLPTRVRCGAGRWQGVYMALTWPGTWVRRAALRAGASASRGVLYAVPRRVRRRERGGGVAVAAHARAAAGGGGGGGSRDHRARAG
jgi:hypothetical protein